MLVLEKNPVYNVNIGVRSNHSEHIVNFFSSIFIFSYYFFIPD